MLRTLIVTIAIVASGCGAYHESYTPGAASGPPAKATISFADIQAKLFQPMCLRCHGNFARIETVRARIGAIQGAIARGSMPLGGPPVPAEVEAFLAEWVNQGMPEFPEVSNAL